MMNEKTFAPAGLKKTNGFMDLPLEEDPGVTEQTFSFEKILKRVLVVCIILLFGELLWLFIINPALPFVNIEINGLEDFDRRIVLKQAGISQRSSYFSLNVGEVESALTLLPQIAQVEVIKKFPDSLSIVLQERKPAALSLALVNGRTMPVIFDKEGVIFEIGDTGGIAIPTYLPIISGMVFENVRLGMRLPHFLTPLLHDLYQLGGKSPELLAVISEIYINKKTFDNFDIIVYPAHSPVKIRMGAELKEEQLSYILLLLDVLKEKDMNVREIDFRTGTASYTVSNES
jgi:cell division septal protein FtsQ